MMILTISTATFAQQLKIAMLAKSETQNIAMCLLKEAYRQIGIAVTFNAFPTTRSLKLSNSGAYDGEASRILAAQQTYPNLIPIMTPTLNMRATAFTIKHTNFKPEGFASLAPYRVLIHKTVIFFENGTKNLPNVIKASDFDAPFKMLKKDRGDIIATAYLAGISRLRSLKMDNVVALKPPIVEVPLYHFLNKKHTKLVPLISQQMIRMQKSGRIEQIYQQYVEQLKNPSIQPDFNNGDPPSLPCPEKLI